MLLTSVFSCAALFCAVVCCLSICCCAASIPALPTTLMVHRNVAKLGPLGRYESLEWAKFCSYQLSTIQIHCLHSSLPYHARCTSLQNETALQGLLVRMTQ